MCQAGEVLASCAIFVFGILVSVFYLYLNRIEEPETSETPKSWDNPDLFRLQYEQLSQGIRSRDNVTIIAGTILITASILLLGTSIEFVSRKIIDFNTKILIILASLAIYVIWLICFNLTSSLLNNISYSRLREMEKESKYEINIHNDIRSKVKNTKWYKYLRRPVWLYFLWVLIIVSITILSIPV